MATPTRVPKQDGLPAPAWQAYLKPSETVGSRGRLRHYEIRRVLGQGGFGVVFRALDVMLNREVAIKMLAPHLADSVEARVRFLREGRAAAAIRHPNVVQIYAVEEAPIPYLVMEFVPGETLESLLSTAGQLPVRQVLELGVQIARGLAAAHERGLIHRDIKPANILIEPSAEPRALLTDFGLARGNDDVKLTQSGLIAGTPMYMAPEQAFGDVIDFRTDLFSLGSVYYEMLAGQPPFDGSSAMAILKHICDDTPPPLAERAPTTPAWLCALVEQLHAKLPADRPSSARAVAGLLSTHLAQYQSAGHADTALIPQRRRATVGHWRWLALALMLGLLSAVVVSRWLAPTAPTVVAVVPTAAEPPTVAVKPASNPPRWTNRLQIQFALVPKGQSLLGGGDGQIGNRPVTIPADFYLGVYEVTQEEWDRVLGASTNPSRYRRQNTDPDIRAKLANVTDTELKRFPVDSVSRHQCELFVKRLNELAAEPGWVYRLPTLDEWEYACRGGPLTDLTETGFDFYFERPTNRLTGDEANFDRVYADRPREVGQYAPNRLGLYDLHGNVFEFCLEMPKNDKGEPDGSLRGGAFYESVDFCRARANNLIPAKWNYNGAGFRIARVPANPP